MFLKLRALVRRTVPLYQPITILAVLSATFLGASGAEYSAGFKIGKSASGFWGKDDLGYATSSKCIVDNTGFLQFSMRSKIGLGFQVEAGYARKGKHIEIMTDALVDSAKTPAIVHNLWQEEYKLEYLEIPLLMQWAPPLRLPLKCFVYAGPQLDFLYTAKKTIFDNETMVWLDISDETPRLDIGIAAGGGCAIPFCHGAILIDARWTSGFLTTAKPGRLEKQVNQNSKRYDRKNYAVNFMVGYVYAW